MNRFLTAVVVLRFKRSIHSGYIGRYLLLNLLLKISGYLTHIPEKNRNAACFDSIEGREILNS